MNGAILLIIGLGIGIGIGLVIGALRINAERGKVALLEKQIEEFRAE